MIEWFNSLLGEAVGTYAAIGVGLLIVIILIIILLRILRSFTGGMFGNKSQNRLGVIEAAAVDNKRRLVLVRRDNVEHLIMIGGTSDILVEAGINRSAPAPRASQTPPAQTGPATIAASPAPSAPKPAPTSTQAQAQAQAPTSAPAPAQSAAPQAAAPRASAPATPPQAPAQRAPAPTPVTPVNPQPAPAAQPQQAAVPPKTTAPVITPPSDSAKVGNDMDRLLNQIAGDAKG
ncbi:MAG: flagellar biosynthetic protein FliO [Hyphomicrobiales bacterium]